MNGTIRNLRSERGEYITPNIDFYQFTTEGCIMAASFLPAIKGGQTAEGYTKGEVADDFWM